MSFSKAHSDSTMASLCVLDQLKNGAIWCTTPSGQLAHYVCVGGEACVPDTGSDSAMDLIPVRLLSPRRPLDFAVSFFTVNRSERLALLAGYAMNRPGLAVASLPSGSSARGQMETYNHVCCPGDFIFNRPGMTLQQVSWWPCDDAHFFLVLSGNCLALYDAHSVSVPYATYRLHFSPVKSPRAAGDCGTATAFTILEGRNDWSAFAVYILRDDGSLFVLCPVVVPGITFNKTDAKNLVDEQSHDILKLCHRTIFSRTQLNQQSSDVLTVQTRSLSTPWKHTPTLQGPVNLTKHSEDRGFKSILHLDNGVMSIASKEGRLVFLPEPHIFPLFQEEEGRQGAPHVFVLQDSFALATANMVENLSEVWTACDTSGICLLKHPAKSVVAGVMNACLMLVDYSRPEAPLYASYKNQGTQLGCIFKGHSILSVHEVDRLQLKCNNLLTDIPMEIHSQAQSAAIYEAGNGEEEMKMEEDELEHVSELRGKWKAVYDRVAAFYNDHQQCREKVPPPAELLHSNLKMVNAEASEDQPEYDQLISGRYREVLHALHSSLDEVDPSMTTSVKLIEDCLKDLGVTD